MRKNNTGYKKLTLIKFFLKSMGKNENAVKLL